MTCFDDGLFKVICSDNEVRCTKASARKCNARWWDGKSDLEQGWNVLHTRSAMIRGQHLLVARAGTAHPISTANVLNGLAPPVASLLKYQTSLTILMDHLHVLVVFAAAKSKLGTNSFFGPSLWTPMTCGGAIPHAQSLASGSFNMMGSSHESSGLVLPVGHLRRDMKGLQIAQYSNRPWTTAQVNNLNHSMTAVRRFSCPAFLA